MVNADGTNLVRLTPDGESEGFPSWSPDGQRIYFVQNPQLAEQLQVMNTDGTNRLPIATLPGRASNPIVSPDGRRLIFVSRPDTACCSTSDDIYLIDADGSHLSALADDPVRDHDPAWSPDGSRIVYGTDGVLFVVNADGTTRTQLTSPSDVNGYDYEPQWSPDGSAVVFTRQYLTCDPFSPQAPCPDELRIIPLSGVPFVSSLVTIGQHPSWRPR